MRMTDAMKRTISKARADIVAAFPGAEVRRMTTNGVGYRVGWFATRAGPRFVARWHIVTARGTAIVQTLTVATTGSGRLSGYRANDTYDQYMEA